MDVFLSSWEHIGSKGHPSVIVFCLFINKMLRTAPLPDLITEALINEDSAKYTSIFFFCLKDGSRPL